MEDSREQRKQVTLYDAVAGRVGYEGFLSVEQPSKSRDTTSTSTTAVAPDEVLFRRKEAPARYAEHDIYEADRYLTPHQKLPDADLLNVIHAYVADFYESTATSDDNRDVRSLDETALLAIGILLEEAGVQALGRTGDLALVEQADEDAVQTSPAPWKDRVVTQVKRG